VGAGKGICLEGRRTERERGSVKKVKELYCPTGKKGIVLPFRRLQPTSCKKGHRQRNGVKKRIEGGLLE